MNTKSWLFLILFTLPAFIISCSPKKKEIALYNSDGKTALILKDEKPKMVPPLPLIDIAIAKLEGKEIPDFDKEEEEFIKYEAVRIGIDVPDKKEVKKYLISYTTRNKKYFETSLDRSKYFVPMIKEIFSEYSLPEELAYLPIIESGFNPYATSSTGAAGIWQFVPSTGKRFGLKINRYIDERRDPYKSTIAAAKYLKYLYEYFHRWDLAIAAYNCGEGCIRDRISKKKKNFWSIKHKLPEQTKEYVPRFFAVALIVRNPSKYGFKTQYKYYTVKRKILKKTAHLKQISYKYNLNYNLLKLYNAHILREKAPKGIGINLPIGNTTVAVKKVKYERKYIKYKVRKGDTLYSISKKFNIPIEQIKKVNKINGNIISVGEILKIPEG